MVVAWDASPRLVRGPSESKSHAKALRLRSMGMTHVQRGQPLPWEREGLSTCQGHSHRVLRRRASPCAWRLWHRKKVYSFLPLTLRQIKAWIYQTILRTFFERKGLTNEATNWLNVVIESHSHFNR